MPLDPIYHGATFPAVGKDFFVSVELAFCQSKLGLSYETPLTTRSARANHG